MARRRSRANPRGFTHRELLSLCVIGLAALGALTVWQVLTQDPAVRGLTGAVVLALGVAGLIIAQPFLRPRPARSTPTISLGEFLQMTPAEFEQAVAEVLGRHGYRLEVTGRAGDRTADLTGTGPNGERAIVQCKRLAPGRLVGDPLIQTFFAMGRHHHRGETLIFVTTSDFTRPARELADIHGIDLVSGQDLVELTAPTGSASL